MIWKLFSKQKILLNSYWRGVVEADHKYQNYNIQQLREQNKLLKENVQQLENILQNLKDQQK